MSEEDRDNQAREIGPQLATSLGHRSGIWMLEARPAHLFVFWDIETTWLDILSRHYRIPWDQLAYYVLAQGETGTTTVVPVDAHCRQIFMTLEAGLGHGLVEWGIWGDERPQQVLLRTASGPGFGWPERWTEFDGYGQARPFLAAPPSARGGRA
jgi:hypothetical protein